MAKVLPVSATSASVRNARFRYAWRVLVSDCQAVVRDRRPLHDGQVGVGSCDSVGLLSRLGSPQGDGQLADGSEKQLPAVMSSGWPSSLRCHAHHCGPCLCGDEVDQATRQRLRSQTLRRWSIERLPWGRVCLCPGVSSQLRCLASGRVGNSFGLMYLSFRFGVCETLRPARLTRSVACQQLYGLTRKLGAEYARHRDPREGLDHGLGN